MTLFFDTNVLVYCTENAPSKKRTKALGLVEQYAKSGEAVISTQVLIELFNVLVNKQKVSRKTAAKVIENYCLWQIVESDLALVQGAIALTLTHSLSIWDAMIVEAARRAGAQTLLSEDLSHGAKIVGVSIRNPFL